MHQFTILEGDFFVRAKRGFLFFADNDGPGSVFPCFFNDFCAFAGLAPAAPFNERLR